MTKLLLSYATGLAAWGPIHGLRWAPSMQILGYVRHVEKWAQVCPGDRPIHVCELRRQPLGSRHRNQPAQVERIGR